MEVSIFIYVSTFV